MIDYFTVYLQLSMKLYEIETKKKFVFKFISNPIIELKRYMQHTS